jgi:hypothetical protein
MGQADIFAATNQHAFRLMKEEGDVMLCDLDSLNCPATAQVVCSDKAFNDPQIFKALTAYIKVLADVGDIMNGNTDLATKCFVDWAKLNGVTQPEDIARMIMEQKPYFGVEATKTRNYGQDLINNFVEFYITSGKIEASQKAQIVANVRDDVLKAAGFKN